MVCKNCGAQLLDGAKFCTVCGAANEGVPVADEKTQYMFDNSAVEPQMPEAPAVPAEPQVTSEPVAPVYEAPVYQQPVQRPVYQAPAKQTPVQQPVYQAPVQQTPAQQPVYQAPVQQTPAQQPGYQAPVQPAPQQFAPPVGVPFAAPVSANISEEEFFERFADKDIKSNYKATMIVTFISVAACLGSIALGNVFSIVDVIVFIVVGILMIKKKNWVLPLVIAIWGGIGTVISMATSGTPAGIIALVFSIWATIGTKKVHDAYMEFKNTGIAPAELITTKKKK